MGATDALARAARRLAARKRRASSARGSRALSDQTREWHVYVVRTRYGALYTGITTDVARRLAEHEDARPGGAKYLRSKGPLELAYAAKIGTRALALKVERSLKALSKQEKEHIVATRPDGDALIDWLGVQVAP